MFKSLRWFNGLIRCAGMFFIVQKVSDVQKVQDVRLSDETDITQIIITKNKILF